MRIKTDFNHPIQVVAIPRRKIVFGLAYLIYLLVFTAWVIAAWNKFDGAYQKYVYPWVLSSLIINLIGLLWADKRNLFDVCVWFVLLSYAFMFGHVVTYVFELQTTLLWDPSPIYSSTSKFHASVFAIACLCLFTAGSMLAGNTRVRKRNESDLPSEKLYYVGLVCLIIGFVCNAYSALSVVSATQMTGSYASYTDASTNGLITSIGFLFVPGVIFLLFSKKLSSIKQAMLLVCSMGYFVAIMTLSGSRKTAIFAILALMLAYLSNKDKRTSVIRITAVVVLGVLFLNLIYIIREMRFSLNEIVPSFLRSLQSFDYLESIVRESLTETGLTFYSVAGIIQTVPDVIPYEFGMTILRSICSVLPIGWAVGDFFDLGSSTYVVNRYLGAPVGASLIGDFYWNWGPFGGCLASALFGYVLARIRNKLISHKELFPFYLSISYIVLFGVRAGFFELARPLFLVVLVPYIISVFYDHYRARMKK
mgnify:CR=1 FL=1|jgi:oligosaccharide repeat unit polymerase